MVHESRDHEYDVKRNATQVMAYSFAMSRALSQQEIKPIPLVFFHVIVKNKLGSETTRLRLVVPLEF